MTKRLRVIDGPQQGYSWELPDGSLQTIGRSRQHNEICVHDPLIARTHCELLVAGERTLVTDLDSETGTFVNGQKIEKQELRQGDLIRIGNTQICFQDIDEVGQAADPAGSRVAKAPASVAAEPGYASSPPKPAFPQAERLGLLSGTRLAYFELGPVLGKGHCGVIFRARDTKNDRTVALKVLQPEFPNNDGEMRRFVEAFKSVLRLSHPNLVTLYGLGRTGLYTWIGMELVEGKSLAQCIQHVAITGRSDWRLAFRAAVHLGMALEFLHDREITHRNLTPRNLLVRDHDKYVKLADLGLAEALQGSAMEQIAMREKVTSDLPYFPPETPPGKPAADPRMGIYSLGAVLYALIAGKPPFTGKSTAEVLAKIRQEQPTPPAEYQPDLPPRFNQTILRMLAKRPEERLPNATAVLAELEQVRVD